MAFLVVRFFHAESQLGPTPPPIREKFTGWTIWSVNGCFLEMQRVAHHHSMSVAKTWSSISVVSILLEETCSLIIWVFSLKLTTARAEAKTVMAALLRWSGNKSGRHALAGAKLYTNLASQSEHAWGWERGCGKFPPAVLERVDLRSKQTNVVLTNPAESLSRLQRWVR